MAQAFDIRLSRRHFLSLPLMLPALRLAAQGPARGRFVDYAEVEQVLKSQLLPADLAALGQTALRTRWPQWARDHDALIRSRIQKGDEDTLANFVLFGVSFTNQRRVTADITNEQEIARLVDARIQGFVEGVARPGSNDRLTLLRGVIGRLGYSTSSVEARERLSEYVMRNVSRYLAEQQRYESAVAASVRNDTTSTFNTTSELYRNRGLSVDTDFRPNFAIETALAEVKRRGLLRAVRRVAVIGPGLDFTDKDAGLDHYPLQTLQPFAVVDSLIRLGMAKAQDIQVALFDISVPALDHITRAVTRARARQPYTIQLVLDRSRRWNRRALEYWQSFGTTIGTDVEPLPLPAQVGNADRRAVRIRPEVVALMEPVNANVVLQRRALRPEQQYDLVVATNILVYYDAFEQALALSNIDAMTAPNGVFLTNDLSTEYPGARLRPSGIVRVDYTAAQSDQVQIYSRSTFQLQLPPV
jgi:hypothetical protein